MSLEVSEITSAISKNKVLVFSKTQCPFAGRTKKLFQQGGIDAAIYELDKMPNGKELQAKLAELTGQKTVPNVFINGKHIGGNDQVQTAFKNGSLKTMLDEAGVSHNIEFVQNTPEFQLKETLFQIALALVLNLVFVWGSPNPFRNFCCISSVTIVVYQLLKPEKIKPIPTELPEGSTSFLLVRHAKSESNAFLYAAVKRYIYKFYWLTSFTMEQMLIREMACVPDYLDTPLSEKGNEQTVIAQSQVNGVKLYKKVYVSPMRRTLQTAVQLLDKHPQKSEVTLVLVPILKEGLVSTDTLPMKFEELIKFLENTGFKYDASLLENYKDKETYPFEIITDYKLKTELLTSYTNECGKDPIKTLCTWIQKTQKMPENDLFIYNRAQLIKKYLNEQFMQVQKDSSEKVLVISHGLVLRALTSTHTKPRWRTFDKNGQPVQNCMGQGMRGSAYMSNCWPVEFIMDRKTKEWYEKNPKKQQLFGNIFQ